jgi:hypothetical protein
MGTILPNLSANLPSLALILGGEKYTKLTFGNILTKEDEEDVFSQIPPPMSG